MVERPNDIKSETSEDLSAGQGSELSNVEGSAQDVGEIEIEFDALKGDSTPEEKE